MTPENLIKYFENKGANDFAKLLRQLNEEELQLQKEEHPEMDSLLKRFHELKDISDSNYEDYKELLSDIDCFMGSNRPDREKNHLISVGVEHSLRTLIFMYEDEKEREKANKQK